MDAKVLSAAIIPTGDEILSGVVLDTDSPEVMARLIAKWPGLAVHRLRPIADVEDAIALAVGEWIDRGADLIVLIGGSGGGHRYSSTLSKDFTHSALERILEAKATKEIYGKNGHLWCKLICGRSGGTLIINLPGPFAEAKAAIGAFCDSLMEEPYDLQAINEAMAQAVIAQYG